MPWTAFDRAPVVAADRPRRARRRRRPAAAHRAGVPDALHRPHAARPRSASPAPPTATPRSPEPRDDHRPASRSTSARTSPASTTPPSGATPAPAARSTSPRSSTSRARRGRAKFDFFFLAEGLRLREHKGQIHDLDVVGRPDTLPVLAALAAVTDRLGLAGTINATFNEPYELARQFADARPSSPAGAPPGTWSPARTRSPGRTSAAAASSPYDERYERAGRAGRGRPAAVGLLGRRRRRRAIARTGQFVRPGCVRDVAPRRPALRRARRRSRTPRGPQGHPVLFQAGDSADGRDFAAATRGRRLLRALDVRGGPGVLRRREGPPRRTRPDRPTTC